MNPITAEVTVAYDYDGSSRNFEDNFELSPMRSYRNRGTNLYQYIDYGNVELIDRAEDLFTIKTRSRHILYKFVDLDEEERKEYSVEGLHDEILSNYDFDELDDFAENEIDNIKIERHYLLMSTRGYSQGDYAEVLIPTDELRKAWGRDIPDEELMIQQLIDNIFWDSPIWARVEIFASQDYTFEGYEMDIPEYLNYPMDIDDVNEKIMQFIKDRFKNVGAIENIVEAVNDALPTEIETPKYC